jgi:hypothetical protein
VLGGELKTDVVDVAHAIQLSVSPVFLLSGIGVLLTLLTNRLSRIVDSARDLEAQVDVPDVRDRAELRRRIEDLARRGRAIHFSITTGTLSALLIALVVALIFAGTLVSFPLGPFVAVFFISCMILLVASLCGFLLEIRIATATVRIGPKDPDRA